MIDPCHAGATSLRCFFRRQAMRWAGVGFVFTLLFAIPCLLYSEKIAAERQLLSTARATVRVFRPMILQGNTRDAELQMQKTLDLAPGESAVIYDADLSVIYALKEADKIPGCSKPKTFCWGDRYGKISLLYPIYFDDQKEDGLYGYLGLTLKPSLDFKLLSVLAFLLLMASVGQAFGLTSALSQSSKQIVDQLSHWASHLKVNPCEKDEGSHKVPYDELNSMQDAVNGLYLEIEKLREKTARDAKAEAHASILREIGHDLRTPHSLLAKYFAIVLDTVRTTGHVNENEVARVESTLKRMGDLLRQVRTFSFDKSGMVGSPDAPKEVCLLNPETGNIVENLRHDPDIAEKGVIIEYTPSPSQLEALVSRTGYYRILENLVRNSAEAVSPEQGHIHVKLSLSDGQPALSVSDNGSGIAPEIQDKIFDLDFTTKPSRGTGLGLAIVNKICTEFGSKVQMESIPDQGSTFTILFQSVTPQVFEKPSPEVPHGKI